MLEQHESESSNGEDIKSEPRKPKRNFNITKAKIGLPTEFKHVSHIGWDPNIGFNMKCDDPQLKKFFQKEEVPEHSEIQLMHDSINTNSESDKTQRQSLSAPPSPNLHRPSNSDNNHMDSFIKKAGAAKNQLQGDHEVLVKKKTKRKDKLTKADIGKPSEFRHVSHVGWSQNGFDIECNNPHLNSFLQKTESDEETIKSSSAPASLVTYPPPSQSENSEGNLQNTFRKSKRSIARTDIGFPFNFRHISHITWDPENGFNIDCDDPELSAFLKLAGVTDKQLQDKETRNFICEFINRHGGYQAIQAEVRVSTERPASLSLPELTTTAISHEEAIN